MEHQMRMVSMGRYIDHKDVGYAAFSSASSLLDYDLVIWDPNNFLVDYDSQYGSPTHMGLKCLSDDASAKLADDIQRRRGEMIELIKLGRAVVVLVPKPQKCYCATGEKQFSGTGKNQRTTRIVNPFDLTSAFPVPSIQMMMAEGKNIEFRGMEPFKSYWNATGSFHYYAAYLSSPLDKPFFYVKGTNRVVGTWIPTERGVFLLLPTLYESDDLATPKAYKEACRQFVDALKNLVQNLQKKSENFLLPAWSNRFLLPLEHEYQKELKTKEDELRGVLSAVNNLKEKIAHTQRFKLLFTGTGSALETQVAAILKEIGFSVEKGPEGRDDLILKYADMVAVAEIKGVTKSAAERHAAQLEKWVAEYMTSHEDAKPKGLLIVNTFCETPIDARDDKDFPDQMLKYSVNRDHCLITTLQLLGIYLTLLREPHRRDELVRQLLETNGRYSGFSDYRSFLVANEEEVGNILLEKKSKKKEGEKISN